ncbi:MAG TPA: IS1634 family transposase [Chitinivibrionales bacterium]
MQTKSSPPLIRHYVGELPILRACADRLGLRRIISRYLPMHGNERIAAVDSLMIMVYNIACGRQPVYELEHWATRLSRRVLPGNGAGMNILNDDRFGRVLDKLYMADRATLGTEIAVETTRVERLEHVRVHNDSTSIKAYGRIGGVTNSGLFLTRGLSKDHRPDLKQLVYSLTISSDGGVPIHYKAYPGNRTDDTTHIETWMTVRRIVGKADFLYVADCKVCSDEQLFHIVYHGGRVVTVMPDTWKESAEFKERLRRNKKSKKVILRREVESHDGKIETFSCFAGKQTTHKRGYRLFWIHSSEKRIRDRQAREAALRKTEQLLAELNGRLNKRNLKKRPQIQKRIDEVLSSNDTARFFSVTIAQTSSVRRIQKSRGRPGPATKFSKRTKRLLTLHWNRNDIVLHQELNIDGIFPILCTDKALDAKEALLAYKFQPRLEKRFSQFKSYLNAAPLLFKKIERVEATMFLYFLALILQAVIERQVRKMMKEAEIEALPIYPENRPAAHPTATKIFALFEGISTYTVKREGRRSDYYRDELSPIQIKVLKLLGLKESDYWPID